MDCKFVFISVIILVLPGRAHSFDHLIVNTTSGPIRGILNNWEGVQYKSYLGIPYAESPTGALRFRPPVPKRPWTQILNATREGFVCPQGPEKYQREKMNEDCLFININVPANVEEKSLPVFIFIHGGAFRMLSGNSDYLYGPQLFIQRGVVFITMNFRLGALGHLSLNIEDASGNASLKDILLSLKWIKNNIERFGGDPNKITIGGHSSGAAMVHYLLLTEKSAGLFQQAILISGNAVCHRSVSRHPQDNALNLARELGLETNDVQTVLKKLREVDVFDIIDAEMNMAKYDIPILQIFSAFVPSIEIKSPHAVITSDPVLINKSGLKQNIPILAGFNYKEGVYLIPKIQKGKEKLKDLELSIPSDIEYPLGSNASKTLAESIGQQYFNSDLSNFTLSNIINLASDLQYIYSTNYWINTRIDKCNSNDLYYYVFDFDGELNWSKINYNIDFPGAAHADEMGYIFVTNKTKSLLKKTNFRSHLVMDITTNLFSNFIKYGNPTPDNYSCQFKWSDFAKNKTMLFINDAPTEGKLPKPLEERLNFWHGVYDEYYRYVKNGGELQKKLIP